MSAADPKSIKVTWPNAQGSAFAYCAEQHSALKLF